MYNPPFRITSKIIDLISRISEKIGEINSLESSPQNVLLRKENRIKTIHSSLAIENNSLSLEQITAIIEGKRVLGNPNEIQEVKNALQAYDLLMSLNPREQKDLLKAHQLMMQDLVSRNGKYRTDGVGIFDGNQIVHLAPPADRVPELMTDLFEWLNASDNAADSTEFTEFMLSLFLKTIEEIIINEQKVTTKVTIKVTINQQKIIEAVKQNPFITQEELVNVVGISRKSIIQNMKKLQENGLLKRIGSNKNGRWQVEM